MQRAVERGAGRTVGRSVERVQIIIQVAKMPTWKVLLRPRSNSLIVKVFRELAFCPKVAPHNQCRVLTGRPSDIKANRRAAGSGKWDSPDDGREGRKEGQSDFDKGTLQITTNLSRLGGDDDA